MFVGELRNITEEHKPLMFVREPRNKTEVIFIREPRNIRILKKLLILSTSPPVKPPKQA
jgi:hypothetical protein